MVFGVECFLLPEERRFFSRFFDCVAIFLRA